MALIQERPETILEEKLNTYSHALGVLLAILGAWYFIGSPWMDNHKLPILIYSASLLLLFGASTWYHASSKPKHKRRLRILDHISIYYLIAGTYTPVCLTLLQESKGMVLLVTVWAIAFFGTVLKLFFIGRFEVFSLVLYGVMGWLIVIDLPFIWENATRLQLTYLAFGGAFYTLGIFFYAAKKIPFHHFIWHLFVLGGAISHWKMILYLFEGKLGNTI